MRAWISELMHGASLIQRRGLSLSTASGTRSLTLTQEGWSCGMAQVLVCAACVMITMAGSLAGAVTYL